MVIDLFFLYLFLLLKMQQPVNFWGVKTSARLSRQKLETSVTGDSQRGNKQVSNEAWVQEVSRPDAHTVV